ncbi:MAG: carboxypeptidase-like regulatory domain-containing protein [Actinobacteria bacterium]|nr:carboxypeptidase-like regulatory domain-containing protein [Actinomycetota bacterium]
MKGSGIFNFKIFRFVCTVFLILLIILASGCRALEVLKGNKNLNQIASADGVVIIEFREPKPYEVSIGTELISREEDIELFFGRYRFEPFGRILDFNYDLEFSADESSGSEVIDDLGLFIYMPDKDVWVDTGSKLDLQKLTFSTSQRSLSSVALVRKLGILPGSSIYKLRNEMLKDPPEEFMGYESGFAYSLDGMNFIGVDAGYLNLGSAHDLKTGRFKVDAAVVQSQENLKDYGRRTVYWKAYVVWNTGSFEKAYVEGYVRSKSGEPIEGVSVFFLNDITGEEHQEVSGSDGFYATYLNDGDYTILARADDGRYIDLKTWISAYSFNKSLLPSKHINLINLTLRPIDKWRGELNLTGELEHPTDIVHIEVQFYFNFNVDPNGIITGKGNGSYVDVSVEPKIEGIFYFIEEAPDFEVTIMGKKEGEHISLTFKADSRIVASIQSPQVGTISEAEPVDWLSMLLLSARLNEVSFPILDGASAKISGALGDASFNVKSQGEVEIFIDDRN